MEKVRLTDSLTFLREQLGGDRTLTALILGGKTPQQVAEHLVSGTKLQDVNFRKQLVEGGTKTVEESTDPMIELAHRIDDSARALRKRFEDKVQGPEQANYALIAKAIFELKGTSVYPDATFTLRLSFGEVSGYSEKGKKIDPLTRFSGLYERAAENDHKPPYRLPRSWIEGKSRLDLSTPFNFVSTADIIGGNSGSPVISREREIVGLIFDGNIHSLVWNFLFDDRQGRAVSVHSEAIVEALRKIYSADALLKELGQ